MNQSWINDLMLEHNDVETPKSWIYWSLLCCISAVAANSYTLRAIKGKLIYYPNIYVILMGESGLGKGYPINLAERLVQAADSTRVIAGRSSIQAIIKELATTRSERNKPMITDSRGFIINGELSTAIIQDPDSITILTDLFDRNYRQSWTNMLKGDGHEKLKEPYITCLFGSSPAHFYDSIPQSNIEGGYIGRNLVVYEEERSKNIDIIDSEEENVDEDRFMNYIAPRFVPHLVKIAANKARIIPEDKARIKYNSWRREWRANEKQYRDKTGFINRVPDHIVKIAMCLALAKYDNNTIVLESDIDEAISMVTGLIYSNTKASEGSGLDPLAAQTKRIVDFLIAAPENNLLRRELLIKGYGDYDMVTLDKILDTLMEMSWIKRERVGIGKNSDYLYHLSGEPLESLMKFRMSRSGGKE